METCMDSPLRVITGGVPVAPPFVPLQVGVKGYFKYEAFKGKAVLDDNGNAVLDENGNPIVIEFPGTRRVLADWQPNKILNSGKNGMAQQNNFHGAGAYAQVGSGSTPPTATDTSLDTYVAGTNTIQTNIFGAQPSATYYGWRRTTYRFGMGVAAGNLSEGGVGWGSSGATLLCRHLIVDLMGDPTTITVQSDEWLDLTYELRYYPPTGDSLATVSIGGVTYDTITRACFVTGSTIWGGNIGLQIGEWTIFETDWSAYDGNIGTIVQYPSGLSDGANTTTGYNVAYSNNSFERRIGINVDTGGWNLGLGIRSISIKTTMGEWQTQFNSNPGGNRIPKTNEYTMNMNWLLSWTERP